MQVQSGNKYLGLFVYVFTSEAFCELHKNA